MSISYILSHILSCFLLTAVTLHHFWKHILPSPTQPSVWTYMMYRATLNWWGFASFSAWAALYEIYFLLTEPSSQAEKLACSFCPAGSASALPFCLCSPHWLNCEGTSMLCHKAQSGWNKASECFVVGRINRSLCARCKSISDYQMTCLCTLGLSLHNTHSHTHKHTYTDTHSDRHFSCLHAHNTHKST